VFVRGREQIGAADHTDQQITGENRHPLDAPAFHQLNDVIERRVPGHADKIAGHDLLDLTTVGSHILLCNPPGPHQEFEPARAVPLGAGLAAAQEVTLGHDPDDLTFIVQYREAADSVVEHQPNGPYDRAATPDRDDVAGHDIRGIHSAASRGLLEFADRRVERQ
jgi:hypothetical protein